MSRTIGQAKFLETLERSSRTAAALGASVISRDKNAYDNDKKTHTNNIKKEAASYKQSVKAIKEVDGIRRLVPGGKSALLDIAEGSARSVVDRVSGYRLMLDEISSKLKEVNENEKDLTEAKKDAHKEYDAVHKLLKSKFITEIKYVGGEGLYWTYPPMVYVAEGRHYFLGRPEAGLSEINENGFSLKLPSYTPDGHIGTYHMRHHANGNEHCLGGYEDILKILAAKHQLSSLIRMFKDYFLSYNKKSIYNHPVHLPMDLALPKVTDDSWIEWKKANPGFKMPDPAEIPDEMCSECERLADDCHCHGCDECNWQEGGCDNCN